jgi:uncharacterized membrane protein YbaN (DUF454 family)
MINSIIYNKSCITFSSFLTEKKYQCKLKKKWKRSINIRKKVKNKIIWYLKGITPTW